MIQPTDSSRYSGADLGADAGRDDEVAALLRQGYDHHEAGAPRKALEYYRRALEAAPDHADALYLAGVACFQLLDPVQAESLLRAALVADSRRSDILINLGNCLHMQNRPEDAENAYRQAIAIDSGIPEAHNNLGNVLRELERLEEAETAFRQALALNPDHAAAACNLAAALRDRGRLDEAEDACRRAIGLDPQLDASYVLLAGLLRDRGRFDEARLVAQQAVGLNPGGIEHHAMLASVLHRAGDTAGALAACDRLLETKPRDTTILAAKALLLNDYGGPGAANPYLDYDRVLHTVRFERADGYDSLAGFHGALRHHLERHPRLAFEPRFKSTRQGYQAERLEEDSTAPVDALKGMIAEAVERYCARCSQTPGHPLAPPPDDMTVSIWVTILNPTGHQESHFHPSAWLSGVYYVALPATMKRDDTGQAGWIEFGRPRDERPYASRPALHCLRPEEGLMVLFPSYLYHRTIPFADETPASSPERRISIAFDVLAG